MFRHTCRVNACFAVGGDRISLSRANTDGSEIEVRVLHKVGELDVLWYACALWSWSSSMDLISSMDASLSLNGASAFRLQSLRKIYCPASRPQSLSYFRSSCVSSKNSMPTVSPNRTTAVQNRFGRRYGYVSKMVPWKTWGHALAGRARTPPRKPPMMVLRNSGQLHTKRVPRESNLPKAPNKRHDGISARYHKLASHRCNFDSRQTYAGASQP